MGRRCTGLILYAIFSFAPVIHSTVIGYDDGSEPTVALARNVCTETCEDGSIEITSPLYTAKLNAETKCIDSINYAVRAEDTINDHRDSISRNWWLPAELDSFALEADDYASSGYDRGHTRSVSMSWGSDHWQDVNCTAVIVPETANLNRGRIRELEEYIVEKAREFGVCNVTITFQYVGEIRTMRNADETHDIPDTITYLIWYPSCVENETHTFINQ